MSRNAYNPLFLSPPLDEQSIFCHFVTITLPEKAGPLHVTSRHATVTMTVTLQLSETHSNL